MPSFRNEVDLTIDGERFRIRCNLGDQLRGERALGRSPENTPLELGVQVWYSAFKRAFPDHPAAKAFGRFVDGCEAADELEDEDTDPLATPTPPAESED